FAERRYEGNGVAVFLDPPRLSAEQLLAVTVEVRQFESAYLWSTPDPSVFETRIFVVDRELAFAGHPVLGAAAVLHERRVGAGAGDADVAWTLRLGEREVAVRSRPDGGGGFDVSMDQGRPEFGEPMPQAYRDRVARALSLQPDDLDPDLPMRWASTGLKYLIVPVRGHSLARARIATASFGELLDEAGALLAYVLDPDGREGRNWVNDGSVEDIATGSASGPAAAYLVQHGRAEPDSTARLAQGRFLCRPSVMSVDVHGSPDQINRVVLTGHVCLTGTGSLDSPPGT
ncbi:MAG: PhzF family phenazine biosynthesis protein, partial [Solirubrobacteraceae bacterium]